jgi:hypothetical protein
MGGTLAYRIFSSYHYLLDHLLLNLMNVELPCRNVVNKSLLLLLNECTEVLQTCFKLNNNVIQMCANKRICNYLLSLA